jgi:hypothetical protein
MSKKDYELIARAIKYCNGHITGNNAEDMINMFFDVISVYLHEDNSKFNKSIFQQACGL